LTVFRNNSESDPMPATTAQLDQQAQELAGKPPGSKTALATGQDAGLSQSLADLRKGYADAAHVQTEESRQHAINRAMVDGKIDANIPRTSVQFIGPRTDHYIAGDSTQVPSNDPVWKMPLDHLRTNLELTEGMYQAVDRLTKTGSEKDYKTAAELGERLQASMARDFTPLQIDFESQQPQQPPSPQARPETFPDGEVYQLETRPDGQLEVRLITGEIFRGDPIEVTRKIAAAKVSTTRWGQGFKQQLAELQAQGEGPPTAILPASGVQYDENGAPVMEVGQTVVPDSTYINLHNMATALGYSGTDELIADQMNLREQTTRLSQELAAEREDRQNKEIAAVFLAQNPSFPNSDESIAALDQIITANNLAYSPENMTLAHTYAVQNGLYRPLSQEDQEAAVGMAVQSRRPAPPPMIRSSNPETWHGDNDPHSIPLDQLRRLAIKQELEGKTPSLTYR
jgi:hypothetical protein